MKEYDSDSPRNYSDIGVSMFLLSIKGRINRGKWWAFTIIWIIIYLTLPYIDPEKNLSILFLIVSQWPIFAVQAKRFHDLDKSAWWYLIGFIPFLGLLALFVFLGFCKGTNGYNQFGPEPN